MSPKKYPKHAKMPHTVTKMSFCSISKFLELYCLQTDTQTGELSHKAA